MHRTGSHPGAEPPTPGWVVGGLKRTFWHGLEWVQIVQRQAFGPMVRVQLMGHVEVGGDQLFDALWSPVRPCGRFSRFNWYPLLRSDAISGTLPQRSRRMAIPWGRMLTTHADVRLTYSAVPLRSSIHCGPTFCYSRVVPSNQKERSGDMYGRVIKFVCIMSIAHTWYWSMAIFRLRCV